MKVSKSWRKNQFAPEKGCRIWRCSNLTLIYILSDENLKHVLRITLLVFERHESLLLTPDIFKPICSIENVKFQWPHAIEYNSPVSRVLVTKEPRFVNTVTFPAHPGRPRGSQSVRDKPRNKRFQARAEEVPRTIFYRPVPHGRSRYGFWLVPENFCVFSAQSESSRPRSRVGSSTRAWKPSSPCFLPTRGWEIRCVFLNAEAAEGVEQAGENKTANFIWEWSLKICIAINSWRLHACRFSLLVELLNERGYTKFIFELERWGF